MILLLLSLASWAAPLPKPTLIAPLIYQGFSLGDVWMYGKTNSPELESAALEKSLEKVLLPARMQDVHEKIAQRPSIPLVEVQALGIPLSFEEASLSLILAQDNSLLAKKTLSLRTFEERQSLGPAPFSGYLNASLSQGFTYPKPSPRQPFGSSLFLASNYRGTVLETGSTYTEKEPQVWRRDDTRLVRDFEEKLLRVSAGDLSVVTSGYQGTRPMGGISVSRQFSIQPYLNVRPLNRTELTLKQPSTIEVFVNDGFVNRLNAPAGPIEISEFPLFSGINKVDLKITDAAGNTEWVNLNLLFDAQLLGKGIQQFAYHVGAPSEQVRSDRRYDDKNITTSLFHRWGLSDHFTLGASFQSDKSSWLAGQDFVWLSRRGIFSGDAGLARTPNFASGAGKIRYRSLDYKLGADKPLRGAAEVEYKGRSFASVGQVGAANEYSWKYEISLSRPITAVTNLALATQYFLNRFGGSDKKTARLDFTTEPFKQWRFNTNYTWEKDAKVSHRFQIILSWLDLSGKFYGNVSYDYPGKTARVEASRNPSSVVDDFRATVGAQNSPSSAQADALVEYTHEKGNLKVDHQSSYLREASGYRRTTHTSSLGASTAIAWAGGKVGWTRPVADSFVLLEAKPLFKKFPIPVNPNGTNAEATVNRYGVGVVPTLTSYGETPITLSSSQLPMGFSLGRDFYLVRPTFRSGVYIPVGGDSAAAIAATLLDPEGRPLSLATGVLTQKEKIVATFFTNRSGYFLVENIPPGNYEITADDRDFPPIPLSLSQEVGFQRLGNLRFVKGSP